MTGAIFISDDLVIWRITVSIICDLLKQLLQWSQLTLTQLVMRLYYSKGWKICKPLPGIKGLDQEILSKGQLLCMYIYPKFAIKCTQF